MRLTDGLQVLPHCAAAFQELLPAGRVTYDADHSLLFFGQGNFK
jgi:hypothetical protein